MHPAIYHSDHPAWSVHLIGKPYTISPNPVCWSPRSYACRASEAASSKPPLLDRR